MHAKARVLFWIGLLCFVPFLFPTFNRLQIPHGTEDRLTLGLPGTPWLVGSRIETKEEVRQGNSSSFSSNSKSDLHFELINWSALFAVVGTVLVSISRHLRANEKPTD
jgi:hypothetical protein